MCRPWSKSEEEAAAPLPNFIRLRGADTQNRKSDFGGAARRTLLCSYQKSEKGEAPDVSIEGFLLFNFIS